MSVNAIGSAQKVLEILKAINDGLELDMSFFQMSERNNIRYIKAINETFGDICKYDKEANLCKPIKKGFINLNPSVFTLMAITYEFMVSNSKLFSNIDDETKKELNKAVKELKKSYKFITKPFENVCAKTMQILQNCILLQRRISLIYNEKELIIKPYKIVFIDENFYLACLDDDRFKMLRISNIKEPKKLEKFNHSQSFYIDEFIQNALQTPWSSYENFIQNKTIHIKLKVLPNVAKYFTKDKKFLPSQMILDTQNDGSKIITYEVSDLMEIKPFIKKWIPFIQVLAPHELKDEILNELKEYLRLNA